MAVAATVRGEPVAISEAEIGSSARKSDDVLLRRLSGDVGLNPDAGRGTSVLELPACTVTVVVVVAIEAEVVIDFVDLVETQFGNRAGQIVQ